MSSELSIICATWFDQSADGCWNSRNSGARSSVRSAPTAASQRPSAQRPCTPASSYAWRTASRHASRIRLAKLS